MLSVSEIELNCMCLPILFPQKQKLKVDTCYLTAFISKSMFTRCLRAIFHYHFIRDIERLVFLVQSIFHRLHFGRYKLNSIIDGNSFNATSCHNQKLHVGNESNSIILVK